MNYTSHLSPQQQLQEDEYAIPYQQLLTKKKLIAFPNKLFVTLDYITCLERILSLLSPLAGQRILDAGCGEGRLCQELRLTDVRVFGLDYSARAVHFTRLFNAGIDIKQANLVDELPYEDDFFDQVVLIEKILGFHKSSFIHNIPIGILAGLYYALYPLTKFHLSILPQALTRFSFRYFKTFVQDCEIDHGQTLICVAKK